MYEDSHLEAAYEDRYMSDVDDYGYEEDEYYYDDEWDDDDDEDNYWPEADTLANSAARNGPWN